MYSWTVPIFIRQLTNLSGILDKANAWAGERKVEVEVLLGDRLAPDMFPLVRQVQIVTDMAKGCAGRLAGRQPPRYEDTERTVEELKARIQRCIDYLKTFGPEDYVGAEERKVEIPWQPGKYLPGFEYATQMAIPNFYFHMTTAYNILRHNGVDLGKNDYLGTLHLRDLS